MPMSPSDRAAALGGALDSLIAIQTAQLAEWVAAGRPPSFSVDDESYSWGSWLKEISDAIADQIALLNKVGGPWIVRSKGRA